MFMYYAFNNSNERHCKIFFRNQIQESITNRMPYTEFGEKICHFVQPRCHVYFVWQDGVYSSLASAYCQTGFDTRPIILQEVSNGWI